MKRTRSDSQRKAMFWRMKGASVNRVTRRSSRRLPGARHALVTSNLKLVHQVAKRFRHVGSYEDLVSEGQLGLMAAAKGFKPRKGYKFSTYAIPHIRGAIQKALGKEQTVRVPEKKLRKVGKLPVRVPIEEAAHVGSEGGIGRAHATAILKRIRKKADTLPAGPRSVFLSRYFSNGHPRTEPWTVRKVAKHLKLPVTRVHRLELAAKKQLGLNTKRKVA